MNIIIKSSHIRLKEKNQMKTRQILNVLIFLATVIVNGLANALPINGRDTGAISDSYPVLFTPAGYVFSIWGLIYLLLLGFTIYQALPSQRDNPRLERVGYWFVLSGVFNIAWIFLWHYDFISLTLVVMLGLLASLIVIYTRLDIGRTQVQGIEKYLVNLPFSVYLGWISVATVANFSITLYDLGWSAFGIAPEIWALLVLAVATTLGILMLARRGDIAYTLVLVWAFAGITVKQIDTSVVAISAAVLAVILLGLVVMKIVRRGSSLKFSNGIEQQLNA
jgi:benzodiazapine receptor